MYIYFLVDPKLAGKVDVAYFWFELVFKFDDLICKGFVNNLKMDDGLE